MRSLVSKAAVETHRAACEAWESAHPEAAVRWNELLDQQKAEDARLYEERYGAEAAALEQMRCAGFAEGLLSPIRSSSSQLRDSACFSATRDWLLDGTTWVLLLMGPPGCGKSQSATWVAHQLLSRGFSPRLVPCLKVSDGSLYDVAAEVYRWRCSTQAGLLVLDDLGEGEQRNEKRAAWRAWVDDVLTQRHAQRRKTIITTNRTIEEFKGWLGERLVDRLREGMAISTNEPSMRGAA